MMKRRVMSLPTKILALVAMASWLAFGLAFEAGTFNVHIITGW